MRHLYTQFSNMKLFKVLAINFALLIGSVEIISFIFFKEKVRIFYSQYWKESKSFGRGYPKNYFIKHPERGFDIAPNSKPVLTVKPAEIEPYPVWGNNIGCFDKNFRNQSKYSIYLAGDSFTWGYAPLEKKFGTLLEEELGVDIASCGVTHTGQKHQFQKFKEVSQKLGYFPETVFVNVVSNDIDNDFSHPHTTIIQGWQVNNVKINKVDTSLVITKIDNDFLKSKLLSQISSQTVSRIGRWDPRKYSATSILLWVSVYRPLKIKVSKSFPSNSLDVYGVARSMAEDGDIGYPINSFVAKNNRKVIKEWIQHAEDNKYDLIFTDIQTQFFNVGSNHLISKFKDRQFFCEFIKKQDSKCFSFINYLDSNGIKHWDDVKWKKDGHFNFKGNQLFANFLSKIYRRRLID